MGGCVQSVALGLFVPSPHQLPCRARTGQQRLTQPQHKQPRSHGGGIETQAVRLQITSSGSAVRRPRRARKHTVDGEFIPFTGVNRCSGQIYLVGQCSFILKIARKREKSLKTKA